MINTNEGRSQSGRIFERRVCWVLIYPYDGLLPAREAAEASETGDADRW